MVPPDRVLSKLEWRRARPVAPREALGHAVAGYRPEAAREALPEADSLYAEGGADRPKRSRWAFLALVFALVSWY